MTDRLFAHMRKKPKILIKSEQSANWRKYIIENKEYI